MRVKNKYPWKIGNPPPFLEDHSRTKHALIAEYLSEYIQILMANPRQDFLKISLVDGFAGGGKYIDEQTSKEVDGSPFVMLNAIKAAEAKINIGSIKPKKIDAEFHFVESNKDHYDYLQAELSACDFSSLLGHNVKIYKNDFNKVAQTIIQQIHSHKGGERAIFVLDQFAYKDVPFQLINKIFKQLDKPEVILTFGVQTLTSFLSDTNECKTSLENIGLLQYVDLKRIQEYKEAEMWEAAIQEQLTDAIWKASGARYITLFYISPKKGWTYWLVHLSNVYKARDVMMQLHWKLANNFKHHLDFGLFKLGYQAGNRQQLSFDLGNEGSFNSIAEATCINTLAEKLPRIIYNHKDPITYESIIHTLGCYTPACIKQFSKALDFSIQSKEIIATSQKGEIRRNGNNLKLNDSFKPHQPGLFI